MHQDYFACVELLLEHGASVEMADEVRFSSSKYVYGKKLSNALNRKGSRH